MECSYCAKNAILIVGKNYCEDHIGYYDVLFFTGAVMKLFNSQHEIDEFLVWAFGSEYPKLSDLSKWHDRIPREERPKKKWEAKGYYKEGQDDYIKKIARLYISTGKEKPHGVIERGLTSSSITSAV